MKPQEYAQIIAKLVSQATINAENGKLPTAEMLVTQDGKQYVRDEGNSETLPQQVFNKNKETYSKEGSILYSYGKPAITQKDLFLISKVVYIVDDTEFVNRGVPVHNNRNMNLIEVEQAPMHPAFNALNPLQVWERRQNGQQ